MRADDDVEIAKESEPRPINYGWVALETAGVMGIGAALYWVQLDTNKMDWDLGWDADSWDRKLTGFDTVRFDTNDFFTNGPRHAFQGVMQYQMGRANGFGMLGATAINVGASVVWEYVGEFREYPSLNDLVINTGAGVAIGEPLLQMARHARGHDLAAAIDPFDALHGWGRAGERDGRGGALLTAGMNNAEATLGVDAELFTGSGHHHRVAFDLGVSQGDTLREAFPRARLRTETTIAGWRRPGRYVGLGSAFLLDRRQIAAAEWDRLGIAQLIGPRLELGGRRGGVALMWEVAGYGDFAMVQAHAFGPELPFTETFPPTSAMRSWGYYYGAGLSLSSRLRVATPRVLAALELSGHQIWSLDGRDRTELDGAANDPEGIVDQRAFGQLSVDVRPGAGRWTVGGALEGAVRRGTWGDLDRRTDELTATARAGLAF